LSCTERGDNLPKEDTFSLGQAKSLQTNQLNIDNRPILSSTIQDGGYQISSSGLHNGNGYSEVKNCKKTFAGVDAEQDIGLILTPTTETSTQRKDHPVTVKNTVLKNNHSSPDPYVKLSLLSSGYATSTVTNSFLHTSNAMDNFSCTIKSSQSKDNASITKPIATTKCTKFEKSKQKEEPVVYAAPSKPQFYNKSTYMVLIRDNVRVVNTKVYSSLPLHSKYMVKERTPGTNKVKLALKSCYER